MPLGETTELPNRPLDGDFVAVAKQDSKGVIQRIDLLEAIFDSEEKAIARVMEIIREQGMNVFIMPSKI